MRRLAACLLLWAGWAAAAEPIVIGQSLGLSPPDRRAQEVQAGTAAFVEAVNARGGIGGRRLRVVTLDDGNVAARHQQNLRTLVREHNAVAFVNCIGEALCRAAATTAGELRVPLVGVHTGSPGINRQTHSLVFRVRPMWDKEADALVLQLRAQAVTRAALVTEQIAPTEPLKLLRGAAARHGLALETVPLSSTTAEGFRQLLAALGAGGYQAAVLELQPATLEALRAAGIDARPEWPWVLMAMSSVSLDHLRTAFAQRLIGFTALVPNPESTATALTAELQRHADANSMSGGTMALTHTGLESYISLKLLGEALRRSGGRSEPDRLATTLEALDGVDLGGYFVSFARGRASGSDFVEMSFRARTGALR